MTRTIKIKNKLVGEGEPVFIIAEAGVNHNGDLNMAKELIDAASLAGADAVKFQTFDPKTLVTKTADKAEYQKAQSPVEGETQYKMLERLMLKREFHGELKDYAESRNLIFLSTPFSLDDALFLLDLGVSAFKVGSSDTNNLPYLREIAGKGLPIILSTGMSTLEQARESVDLVRKLGNDRIVVLQCTSSYPAKFEDTNIRAMVAMRDEFNVLAGFSDHTMGIEASIAAVALGAVLVEKHFTLDRALPGPDHKASLEPGELTDMVKAIRNVSVALGSGEKRLFPIEEEVAKIARKSLIAKRFISKGAVISEDDIIIKRPGTGLEPKNLYDVVGKKTLRNISEEELLNWDMFSMEITPY
jgi:N-acetylneuraminate synthase/N,N'-diacetyllegionaminate synthase